MAAPPPPLKQGAGQRADEMTRSRSSHAASSASVCSSRGGTSRRRTPASRCRPRISKRARGADRSSSRRARPAASSPRPSLRGARPPPRARRCTFRILRGRCPWLLCGESSLAGRRGSPSAMACDAERGRPCRISSWPRPSRPGHWTTSENGSPAGISVRLAGQPLRRARPRCWWRRVAARPLRLARARGGRGRASCQGGAGGGRWRHSQARCELGARTSLLG